ncbi:hypothetical protein [Cohnella soli]|uniref:Transcriptional regulator n=1 Tax=Cohnella soli TaxID=425005 RepID=A0ABW0HPL1_9BACL
MASLLNDVLRPLGKDSPIAKPSVQEKRDEILTAPSTPSRPTKSASKGAGSSAAVKGRVRRERSDKKKDIKFPVTPEQREELRRLASEMRIMDRKPGVKYETISNTAVLKKAMEQFAIFPERYPPLLYKDSGQYMHAEPILKEYEQIEALARRWNLSYRKTVYRLIMNYIFIKEVDMDAYRKQQK